MGYARIIISAILNIILFASIFFLGFSVAKMMDAIDSYVGQERVVQGLYFQNKTGDWICVNVEGMSFERAYEVCRHEAGHEIFAEYCEQSEGNWERCVNATKEYG